MYSFARLVAILLVCATSSASAQLVISEFRVRGPSGANDEFVTICNNSPTPFTVNATDGSGGFALASSDGMIRFIIPNGTVIPAYGHYLGVNSVAYSLSGHPAGNGTTATGNSTYTTDIADNAGIALFSTGNTANFAIGTRLDAVGSTSEANTLYKEGTGYSALTPFSIDYAFYRDLQGTGQPKDTDNNAADFLFVDTNGTSAGAGQRLGAPGPANLSGPVADTNDLIPISLLDIAAGPLATPNFVNDTTSDPANNSTFGTLSIRRTFTNNTGAPLTRLRFRVVRITTFPAPSGTTDLRPRTCLDTMIMTSTGMVNVRGTTLEQPPSQPNGGGFNSCLSVNAVSTGTPLANGSSISVQFLLGLQQTGTFEFWVVAEGLPNGSFTVQKFTNIAPPAVVPTAGSLAYTENQGAAAIDPGLSVADLDSANLVGASVSITANFAAAEDTLAFTDQNGITGSYNSGTGVLTLTGTTTVANYQTALRSVTYSNSSDTPSTAPRTITFSASDTSGPGTGTRAIAVTAVNDAPTLAAIANPAAILEDAAQQTVALSGIAAGAGESQTLTVTATSNNTALIPNPAVTYTSPNATGSLAYTPVANASGTATITVTVNDGGGTANGGVETVTQTFTVTVTPVSDAPVIASVSFTPAAPVAGDTVVFTVAATDPEGDALTTTYAYGDGITDGTGRHAYAAAGTFTATISVSDGVNTVTSPVTVVVSASASDDADGFDAFIEVVLKTDPTSNASRPFNLSVPTAGTGLVVKQFRLKPGAKKKASLVRFTGSVPAPAVFEAQGQPLILSVGGVVQAFVLDGQGRSATGLPFDSLRIGKTRNGAIPFQINLAQTGERTVATEAGGVRVILFFGGVRYELLVPAGR